MDCTLNWGGGVEDGAGDFENMPTLYNIIDGCWSLSEGMKA